MDIPTGILVIGVSNLRRRFINRNILWTRKDSDLADGVRVKIKNV